eukprot:CAMPEP_0182485812 /NCGR_PEP_ID=MMETSP1319-20130603/45881_1 /TAXON_ID=172717 /ORGANISM="Bolidomonas pacifica, Strain RCC208" /LENGTH=237 /DNA_ID=CAMNT_0024687843 /DNA_START=269 /DNA_END=979 /DNA_ORIENTATION=-
MTTPTTVTSILKSGIAQNLYTHSPSQLKASKYLTSLANILNARHEASQLLKLPPPPPQGAFLRPRRVSPSFFPSSSPPGPRRLRGAFIHGPVGSGKTLLMDAFHATLRTTKKRRVHFHEFLQSVHKEIHALRTSAYAEGSPSPRRHDPIASVGLAWSRSAEVLCLDEFQVTDVFDALMLSSLLRNMLDEGVVLVCTSNREVGRLYEGGVNYEYFRPTLDRIRAHAKEIEVGDGTDHR